MQALIVLLVLGFVILTIAAAVALEEVIKRREPTPANLADVAIRSQRPGGSGR